MTGINTTFALEAEEKLSIKKYQEAIDICENGLRQYPNYPVASCVLAKAYYLSGDKEKALDVIYNVEQEYPLHSAITQTREQITTDNVIHEVIYEELETEGIISEINDKDLELNEHLIKISEITSLIKNIKNETNDEFVTDEEPEEKIVEELATEEPEIIETSEVENITSEVDEREIGTDEQDLDINEHLVKISEITSLIKNIKNKTNYEFIINEEPEEENLIKKLYSIDLELPKTECLPDFGFNKLKLNHLKSDIDFTQRNFLIKNINFDIVSSFINSEQITVNQALDDITQSQETGDVPKYDSVTQEMLDIAEGLEGAQKILNEKIRGAVQEDYCETPIVASETIAKIYVKQGKFAEARQVYDLLIQEKPEKKEHWLQQIEKMEQ